MKRMYDIAVNKMFPTLVFQLNFILDPTDCEPMIKAVIPKKAPLMLYLKENGFDADAFLEERVNEHLQDIMEELINALNECFGDDEE